MASWWLLVLLSSQVILHQSPVDATFDIGLRWLRGESTLLTEFWNATTTGVTTATAVPRTTPLDVLSTQDALGGRSTAIPTADVVTTAAATTTTTTAATTLTTEQTTLTMETDASTTATTEVAVPGATPVSLDDLALQIGNVPDPVLHMVETRDGSQSFVVISGRDESSVTTTEATITPASTTEATATPDTTTPDTEATTTTPHTTLSGTTVPAAPNTTSPYLILLQYLRPFIFGRFGDASTTTSTEATAVATPAIPTHVPNSNPATTLPATLPTPTTVPDLSTYPAEFRVTTLSGSFTTQDPLGNATSTQTLPTNGEPSTRAAAFDATATPTPTVSTTVVDPGTSLAHTIASVALSSDAAKAQTSLFSTPPVTSEPTTFVTTVTADTGAPSTRSFFSTPVTGTTVTSQVPAALDSATTEDPTATQTSAPGQLGSLVSRLIDEAVTHSTIGDLRRVTFAPWPPTAAPKTSGGDGGADEPKYRYFYDPTQVMQVL